MLSFLGICDATIECKLIDREWTLTVDGTMIFQSSPTIVCSFRNIHYEPNRGELIIRSAVYLTQMDK